MRNKGFYSLVICFFLLAVSGSFRCSQRDPKFNQYYAQGEQLYTSHCSNCHQSSGKGLALVYPPLANSDYVETHFAEILCQMKYGIKGPLLVNGQEFNQPMPGVRSLTELEIAEIATYIYNTWGHKRGPVDLREVTGIVRGCQP